MMTIAPGLSVRDTIERDLNDEPQSVVRVHEVGKLKSDLAEYVLTDQLAHEFGKVLERVIDAAKPAGPGTEKIGIWVSGFFGSGKSHFAKLAGHLLADTPVGDSTTRTSFRQLLHAGRRADDRLAELLQEATTYRLGCQLVPFDIASLNSVGTDRNVALIFLRSFYQALGLSSIVAFAEREAELQMAGLYDQFTTLYEQKTGSSWSDDKDVTLSSAVFAEFLAKLLPGRFPTVELAHASLEFALSEIANLNIDGVTDRLLHWLDQRAKSNGKVTPRIVFVADEVGAWAGRDLERIEQIRTLVENFSSRGEGRLWLIATSQEKLSDVLQNAPTNDPKQAKQLIQRLEARFQTNVHLESSEVGSVIEVRVLRKKPSAISSLDGLWETYQQQLRDIAEQPGLELGGTYPGADKEAFRRDYPFLPYQLRAAADIFGGMRGVKVSSGARSMIKVVFDATRELAGRPLGALVGWDQIFDSANRDNEFADEQYLGSQGLTYIATADRDVTDAPISRPSRLLKVLWLIQQSTRIPRTPANLARLLVGSLDTDVLQLERDVTATLEALAARSFVRQEVTTNQWRFLSQDEVTVEKIVQRLAEDVKQKELRDATHKLYAAQIQSAFTGRITVGKSNTSFDYGLYLSDAPLRNEVAAVSLRVALAGTPTAAHAAEECAANLDAPVVHWIVEFAQRLDERLRRQIAIERLPDDEEYRRVATERMRFEAEKLETEAAELRRSVEDAIANAVQRGTLICAGESVTIDAPVGGKPIKGAAIARPKIEEALRGRIYAKYSRFQEGDRPFNPANLDKLFTVASGDRATLDPGLALFAPDGHVHGNHVLVEALEQFLKSSTKTQGQHVTANFADVPYGWPSDLLRYVAAAMFVDGKIAVYDVSGKRYDDPKASGARSSFGTAPFKNARLEIEEDSLSPEESNQARILLTELKHAPTDGGESALRDATLKLCVDLTKRATVLDKAHAVSFPLPVGYDLIVVTVEDVSSAGSRVKVVRGLIAHGDALRDAVRDLKRLEDFDHVSGFAQYGRAQRLLSRALEAGLADDPTHGATIQTASDEVDALIAQRRVLDEWNGSYQKYRLDVLDAYKAVYVPLRAELAKRSHEAYQAVIGMPEYKSLELADKATVRVNHLGEGKPLCEVPMPELIGDQQLLDASAKYSIAHARALLNGLDVSLGQAKAQVIDLYNKAEVVKGKKAKTAVWKPGVFIGQSFETEAQVDAAFDAEKERIKALIREGKTVQAV